MTISQMPHLSNPPERVWKWSDILLIIIGIGVIFIAAIGFIGLIIYLRGDTYDRILEQPTINQSVGLAALEVLALGTSVYFLGMRRIGLTWRGIGLKSITSRWILGAMLISFIAIPISGLVTVLVLLLLGQPLENPQLDFLIPTSFNWYGAIGMVLFGGLAVPFAEELLFRGVLYQFWRERWGIWPAVILSSLVFAIVHVDIAVGVTAFILGMLLAVVYEYSRSLWASILIHAVNNSLKIILLYALLAFGFL